MFGFNRTPFAPNLFDQQPFNPNVIANHAHQISNNDHTRGVVIEEISSEEDEEGGNARRENPRKHGRSGGEPYVEEPDEEERRIRHVNHNRNRNDNNWVQRSQPQTQARSFSFQSSTVTYGGANGAYYTSSTTRKMGDNGVMLEEKKEADTTTGKAEHRISKGIHDKGHTVMRKLNPDGKVDTMQTLHNLDQDELAGFHETWKGNARMHLPGWSEGNNVLENMGSSSSSMPQLEGGWALPSTEQPHTPPNRATSQKTNISNWQG